MQVPGQPPPWHRQPLVWLLIAIPMTAVLASFVTVYLAVSTDDGLVTDDYYQRGKQINRVLARDEAATRYGLRSRVRITAQSGRVTAVLQAGNGYRMPPALDLQLLHATRAGLDQRLTMAREPNGVYAGLVKALPPGHWHVQLAADDWRLTGSMHVAPAGAAETREEELSVSLYASPPAR